MLQSHHHPFRHGTVRDSPRLYPSIHSLVEKKIRSHRKLRRGGLGHGSNVGLAEILGLTGLAVLLRY